VRRVGAGERSGGRWDLRFGASPRSDVGRRRGRRRGVGGSGSALALEGVATTREDGAKLARGVASA
jgi:hypothetical protein